MSVSQKKTKGPHSYSELLLPNNTTDFEAPHRIYPVKPLLTVAFDLTKLSEWFTAWGRAKGLFNAKGLQFSFVRTCPEPAHYAEARSLVWNLRHNHNIVGLGLDFGPDDQRPIGTDDVFTLNCVPQFNKLLRSNNRMRALKLHTPNKECENFSILGVLKHLEKMGSLTELSILANFRFSKIESLAKLGKSLRFSNNLKTLELRLSNFVLNERISHYSSIENPMSKYLKALPKLEKVYLGDQLLLDQHSIDYVTSFISKRKAIQLLHFDCVPLNTNIESLLHSIPKCQNLNSIALNLLPGVCKPDELSNFFYQLGTKKVPISNLEIRSDPQSASNGNISHEILKDLRNFSSLKSLSLYLNFGWLVWNDQSGQTFSTTLSKMGSSLDTLNVYFVQVRYEEVDEIRKSLKNLPMLTTFSLYIQNAPLISNKHLKAMFTAISQCHSLKNLTLAFEECSDLSDDGFFEMKNMELALFGFYLRISKCYNIQNSTLKHALDLVRHQNELNELVIQIENCLQVSPLKLPEITFLGSIQSLRSLHLLVSGGKKVNKTSNEDLKNWANNSGLIERLRGIWLSQTKP